MKFEGLAEAHGIRRYKRFLADVIMPDGSELTVHCANSGRMTSCFEEGALVYLSHSGNPKRKHAYTLELVKMPESYVAVNTQRANEVATEWIANGGLDLIGIPKSWKREVRYPGDSRSRMDIWVEAADGVNYAVEVKSCTLAHQGKAMFPDAPTERGRKHLQELMGLAQNGSLKPIVLFTILRNDVIDFMPADHIDAKFAELLQQAVSVGVEVWVLSVNTTPAGLTPHKAYRWQG